MYLVPLLFLLLRLLLAAHVTWGVVTTPIRPTTSTDPASASCEADDDATRPITCQTPDEFRQRVRHARGPDGRLRDTKLRGVRDHVLTADEGQSLWLPEAAFVVGGGYENDIATPTHVAGLGLPEMTASSHNSPPLTSEQQYDKLLEFRERARATTEQALGLCPGTLRVEFTHLVQKTPGGKHG